MTDIKNEAKDVNSEFPAMDEEEDLEVVSEVIEQPSVLTSPQDSKLTPSPPTTVSNEGRKTNSSWGGLFGRRLGSGKRGSLGTESTTGGPKKRDWSKEQEALNKFKTQALNTFSQMGTRMGEGGSFLFEASKRRAQATAETLKKIRIFKTPLESLCKAEAVNGPCPRLMLICCTTIAANGLSCQDIFKLDPPETVISAISEQLHQSNGLVLLPSEATAEVLAGVVKKFLIELMEPLLTYGLVEDWIGASEDLDRIKKILDQLPIVNRNVLELLLDCLHRISANSAENNMDPDSLAEALVPCLLWRAPTPSNESSKKVFGSAGSMTGMFARTLSSDEKTLKMQALPQDTTSAPGDEVETSKQTTRIELQGEDFKKFSRVKCYYDRIMKVLPLRSENRDRPLTVIAPSILSSDFARLSEECQRMIEAGADWLHVDVMDGHFVPNLTLGPPIVKALRKHTDAFLDCHLMVTNPEQWVKDFAEAGCDMFTFHLEVTSSTDSTQEDKTMDLIKAVKKQGMHVGIALKPGTPVQKVFPYVPELDLVLILTVEPGFGGQAFMEDIVVKCKTLREKFPDLLIEVDGGLAPKTIEKAAAVGANVIVAGSAIFGATDPAQVIKTLRSSVDHFASLSKTT